MKPADSPAARASLVVLLGVCAALHVGKLPVAIPALQQSLGLTLVQGGFLLSLLQLAGMTLGLLIGLLADRMGPRRVMLAGLLLLGLGSAAGALSGTVAALLATRVLEGVGFLLTVLPAPGLIRRQVVDNPAALARALGWWGAYMPVGMALALLAGAPAVVLWGWPAVWAVLALLAWLGAWALWRWIGPDAAPAAGAGSTDTLGQRLRRTLRAPGPWLLAVGFLMYSGQWLAVVGFLPTIYHAAGFGATAVGLLSALAAGVNMVGNVSAGRLLARGVPPGWLMAGGYVAMALGALLTFTMTGWPLLQYASVLLFSALGGWVPGTLFGLVVRLTPGEDTVSTTVGWMQQLSAMGQFLGPPVVAWAATQWGGWQWTWVITGTCSLVGIGLAWQVQRQLRRAR